jgi:hypothetical protein
MNEIDIDKIMEMSLEDKARAIINNDYYYVGRKAGKTLRRFSYLEIHLAYMILKELEIKDDEFQSWNDDPGYY